MVENQTQIDSYGTWSFTSVTGLVMYILYFIYKSVKWENNSTTI